MNKNYEMRKGQVISFDSYAQAYDAMFRTLKLLDMQLYGKFRRKRHEVLCS